MGDGPQGDGWPWSAVGRVQVDGAGPCSGILIEPRIVLTVGHCVAVGSAWRAKPTERLSVIIKGEVYAVAAVRLAAQSPLAPDGAIADLGHDWALLELVEAPSVEPVPYGGTAAPRRVVALEEPVFKVGWPGEEQKRDVACTILEIAPDGRLLSFRCPGGVGEGRSGSALLVRTSESWEVVALQAAESKTAFSTIGLAILDPG